MNTYVQIGLEKLKYRIDEINIILNEAKENQSNTVLYNALCRSAQVMSVAHLEGFLKDFIKDIIDDISSNLDFKDAPIFIKRTHCEYFMNKTRSDIYDEKIRKKLIESFEDLNPIINVLPFLSDRNKNPSPNVVDKYLNNFEVKQFFEQIDTSLIDTVFSGTPSEINTLFSDLEIEINNGVNAFPYSFNLTTFSIRPDIKLPPKQTLWKTFLDSILSNRHNIAHGTTISNSLYHQDIINNVIKLQILIYSIILVVCAKISASVTK